MALLTAITPTAAGTAWAPAGVGATDTISVADLGTRGAYLVVINGNASSDTVTVQDASLTPAGNAATNLTNAVANGTTEIMFIPPATANLSTGVTTVTHSVQSTVTCVVIRIPG